MTDQLSFLPMLDDAEHPTWLLNGKPGIQNDCGVYVDNVFRFREGKLTGVNVEVELCAEGDRERHEYIEMVAQLKAKLVEQESDKRELKSFIVLYDGKFIRAYNESEADKVIAELEEKHKTEVKELLCLIRDKENNFNRAFDSEEKEIRHQKYKRCLANAEAAMHKRWRNDEGFDYARSTRHMKTWLELAEKFKPNSTAQ